MKTDLVKHLQVNFSNEVNFGKDLRKKYYKWGAAAGSVIGIGATLGIYLKKPELLDNPVVPMIAPLVTAVTSLIGGAIGHCIPEKYWINRGKYYVTKMTYSMKGKLEEIKVVREFSYKEEADKYTEKMNRASKIPCYAWCRGLMLLDKYPDKFITD